MENGIISNNTTGEGTNYENVILLTGSVGGDSLAEFLVRQRPDIVVVKAQTARDLAAISQSTLRRSRLIGFSTDVVVPPMVLDALGFGAYNFHPGSPAYPGWAPFCFATYDGARVFGATAHYMTAHVDAGAIVGTELFEVMPGTGARELSEHALIAMLYLFRRLGSHLANQAAPLAALPVQWSGHRRTRADLAALCDIPPDIDRGELIRRLRSATVADTKFPVPTITLHGVQFALSPTAGDKPSVGLY